MLPESFTESVRSQRSYHFLQDYFEMSFLELTAFPSASAMTSSSTSSGWQSQQHYDDFAETVRHVGIRLSGTTDMIAEALLQAQVVDGEQVERIQPVLRSLFRRNLAAEV
jgi:hypothetical protein